MITDYFAALTDILRQDYQDSLRQPRHGRLAEIVRERLLRPFLPTTTRFSTGSVMDVRERQAGPFDVVASADAWPAVGQGESSIFMADGVMFALSARDWARSDLTQFAQAAAVVKTFPRQSPLPIQMAAFSFTPLELKELQEFLTSAAGQAVDAVYSLDRGLIVRNSLGWYGTPAAVPFVTESVAGPALKFFAFWLMQCVQSAAGKSFGWADYQHL